MSRLAEAEAKLNAALDALEQAIDTALADKHHAAADRGSANEGANDIDRASVLAEIDRIDGQLATALKLITNVQRSNGTEGGTA